MTSPLDKFTYDTFDIQASPTEVIRRPGHALGGLAAIKQTYRCPSCDKDHEMWTILNLASAAYIPPAPIFRNIDDAANFILDVVDLFDWPTADAGVVKRNYLTIVKAILANDGLPIMAFATLKDFPENMREGVEPGTQGFNGYPRVKQ